MAVSIFYGMTESGKSFLAKKSIEQFSRSIIFDYVGCFDGDLVTSDFSINGMLSIFNRFKDKKRFRIVFRPDRATNEVVAFNKCAWLALMLGRQAKKRGDTDRLIFLVDEADMICSPSYQTRELKELVNVGRHDNVDSWFIARMPQRLHTDIRGNASGVYCFRLYDESALGFLRGAIGKKAAEKIKSLQKYSFLAWRDTGEVVIYDKNQKKIESWS